MKKLTLCPVCNKQNLSKVHTCKDHSTSKEDFTITKISELGDWAAKQNAGEDKNEVVNHWPSLVQIV